MTNERTFIYSGPLVQFVRISAYRANGRRSSSPGSVMLFSEVAGLLSGGVVSEVSGKYGFGSLIEWVSKNSKNA